jgi:hypothetical protein
VSAPRPKRLYRVEWRAALGWPEPERRHDTARNYTSAENAARQVQIIEALPSHLELTGVAVADCEWVEIDPTTLPEPKETDDEDA